ncbi:MAG: VOC family protein [Nitrososphaerales archaeon]
MRFSFTYTAIRTRNLGRSVAFYRNALGMKLGLKIKDIYR